ncbi:hypothetical protein [Pseudomonas fluorescens]|uniref:hypothetical protein n=1 Tax=Pseudomonas TaxID=286 RepID=UPI003D04D476
MAKSHDVDLLSAGFVIKTARDEKFNEKLTKEVLQIKALCQLHPDQMIPVIHEGAINGRAFYALEKISGSTLSNIVFDAKLANTSKRASLQKALATIGPAISREYQNAKGERFDLLRKLQQEWDAIKSLDPMFLECPIFNGVMLNESLFEIYTKASNFARSEKFSSVDVAHLNFHFGNVISKEGNGPIVFIDPDDSVRGADPLFGLARFAFSFWHEIGTESRGKVTVDTQADGKRHYRLAEADHQTLLDEVPEISHLGGIADWILSEDLKRLYALTAYCFLRSIRLNNTTVPAPCGEALPQEVLALGCIVFLSGQCPLN